MSTWWGNRRARRQAEDAGGEAGRQARTMLDRLRGRVPTSKTCPYCKGTIPLDARVCVHCGNAV